MATLDDLIAERTQAEYLADVNAEHDTNQVPRESWLSVVNVGLSLTQIVAEMLAELRGIVRTLARSMFLSTASGVGLTLFSASQYQETRDPALTTQGQFLFTSVSGAPAYNYAAGTLTVGQPGASGQRYVTTEALVLPSGSSVSVSVEALEAGADGNLPVGSTLELKTSLAGVSVTNPVYADGTWITRQGQDEEADGTVEPPTGLKGVDVSKWGTTGAGGSDDALYYWARSIPTGYTASRVTRARVYSGRQADGSLLGGAILILIAGAAGALPGADVTAVTAIFDDHAPPTGMTLAVRTTSNNTIAWTATVYARRSGGLTADEIEALIASAVAAFAQTLDIGATIYPSHVDAVIEGAHSSIRNMVRTVPAGDTAITQDYDETAVFSLAGISVELVD